MSYSAKIYLNGKTSDEFDDIVQFIKILYNYRQGRRKPLRTGGAIQIVKTHLYGEKLHSYGRTVNLGGASAP